jgi:hypothetical protein
VTSVPLSNRGRINSRVVSTPHNQLNHKQSRLIRIENPIPGRSPFTNRNAAQRSIDRGRAKWVDASKTEIRYCDDAEVVRQRQVRSEVARDTAYWHDVAAQRGGEDVVFEWNPSLSNGYLVRTATQVALPKGAQVAHL